VNSGESKIYRFKVPEEEFKYKDLKITLISVSGKAILYVNPEIVPEFTPMSIWKEEGGVSKSILVPYSERNGRIQQIKVLSFLSRLCTFWSQLTQ
jgi:hypothetical protein